MTGSARAGSLAALASALVACATGPSRMQGHWRGIRAEGVGAGVESTADAFVRGLEIDVRGDVMSVTLAGERQVGRFRVVHEDSKKIVVITELDGPADPQEFGFGADGAMRWRALPGRTIVFARD
jgi:hypothetical protein